MLEALRARVRLLGFVSGRGLADVERLVGLDGCAYAGNHGMELHLPGSRPRLADGVAAHVPAIAAFAAMWPPERLATGDLRLEEKGATLSVHARGARDPAAAELLLREVALEAAGARARRDERARGAGGAPARARSTRGRRSPSCWPAPARGRRSTPATTAPTPTRGGRCGQLREAGALEHAVGLAVASAEVPPEVRAAADAEVDGPAGALEALRMLLH